MRTPPRWVVVATVDSGRLDLRKLHDEASEERVQIRGPLPLDLGAGRLETDELAGGLQQRLARIDHWLAHDVTHIEFLMSSGQVRMPPDPPNRPQRW